MPGKISKETIVADLQRLAKELGHAPLITEFERLGCCTAPTVRKRFGSWGAALKAANLKLTSEHRRFWTDKELHDELARLEQQLGHKPSFREIKDLALISPDTFARRIGCSNFVTPDPLPDWSVDNVSVENGMWVSGFVAGEGSFSARMGSVTFSISQRSDDIGLLQFVAHTMGLPEKVYEYSNAKRRADGEKCGDVAMFSVSARHPLKERVIPFFDRFPLRGRKATEFEMFKTAVLFLCARDKAGSHKRRYSDGEKKFLSDITATLKAFRADPTAQVIIPEPPNFSTNPS